MPLLDLDDAPSERLMAASLQPAPSTARRRAPAPWSVSVVLGLTVLLQRTSESDRSAPIFFVAVVASARSGQSAPGWRSSVLAILASDSFVTPINMGRGPRPAPTTGHTGRSYWVRATELLPMLVDTEPTWVRAAKLRALRLR